MHDQRSGYAEENGMRTTLDLPEELLAEAMEVSHQRTKTGVIIAALEDLVRKSRLRSLKRFKGKLDLDVDLHALRKRK
jgi:Arc/MetJ family transcription regulator